MAANILSCGACVRRAMQLFPPKRTALERTTLLRSLSLPQMHLRLSSNVAVPSENATPEAPERLREKVERAVNKQMRYGLDDPWKIANAVKLSLAKDKYDEALLLAQKTSAKYPVVVSWNLLIEYMLEKQQLRQAIKLYNEMKKRRQLPNVQTFTILFRGFARSQHPKLAVAEALKYYHILVNDSRLEANTTHLNAVLQVCSKAGDLDSMFTIVDTINNSTRKSDAYTYTTIVNALRHGVLSDIKDLPEEQQHDNINQAIGRAKTLWKEAIGRWRQGQLVIDEEMVCAFGRIIIMAPNRTEKREVFELLEQTMNIPNLTKTGASAIEISSPQLAQRGAWVKPDRNTLSLLLTALASSKMTVVGIKYWNLMVREHKIVPDMDIWMRLYGMFKVGKASAHACETLDAIPDSLINARHYMIAFQACARDNINQNVMKNANMALDSMIRRLKWPDPLSMRLYLQIAIGSHSHLRSRSDAGDVEGSRRDYGLQIINALDRLWEPYSKIYEHHFKTRVTPENQKANGPLYNDQRETIALARIMYSAYNKVIDQKMLPEEMRDKYRHVGARINRQIRDFFANREEIEPNLSKPKTRSARAAEREAEAPTLELDGYMDGKLSAWDTTAYLKRSRPASRREMRERLENEKEEEKEWSNSRRRSNRLSQGAEDGQAPEDNLWDEPLPRERRRSNWASSRREESSYRGNTNYKSENKDDRYGFRGQRGAASRGRDATKTGDRYNDYGRQSSRRSYGQDEGRDTNW